MNSVLPYTTIAENTIPGGKHMVLQQQGSCYFLFVDGVMLMSSVHHFSEEELARLALGSLSTSCDAPSVMIGGLGMGYTLRDALDRLPSGASVSVIELAPSVVQWNRDFLGSLANHPLNDPRVILEIDAVETVLSGGSSRFDCILLDLDNGAEALTLEANEDLYTVEGLMKIRQCLRPQGVLGIWFLHCEDAFVRRMETAGFDVTLHLVDAGEGDPPYDKHAILIGRANP